MRAPGFYIVTPHGLPKTVAEWTGEVWYVIGCETPRRDEDFERIGNKIEL